MRAASEQIAKLSASGRSPLRLNFSTGPPWAETLDLVVLSVESLTFGLKAVKSTSWASLTTIRGSASTSRAVAKVALLSGRNEPEDLPVGEAMSVVLLSGRVEADEMSVVLLSGRNEVKDVSVVLLSGRYDTGDMPVGEDMSVGELTGCVEITASGAIE